MEERIASSDVVPINSTIKIHWLRALKAVESVVVYVIKLPIHMYSKKSLVSSCAGG